MLTAVKKTPPYLKHLAESRARAAGEVSRRLEIVQDAVASLGVSQGALDELDLRIRTFEARLNPADIAPIRAHKLYPGSRGLLKKTVSKIIEPTAPGVITTSEIAKEIHERFQLEFSSADARGHWRNNSIGRLLRTLCKEGLVERLHVPKAEGVAGRWRWRSAAVPSSDHLRAQLEAEGGAFQQYDDSHA
jgi:hypothetical protein